ncbi:MULTISPECIES: metalloregulator ArsR/SmtB family transcription factor [unclassified Mesorhizobium]|uniref:ArsR/SmtB family transcription factor n=1 Tax=unclassified Mesorhizobium TaxID=325217 RepID=UPI000FDC3956|nr:MULTISPECIES: metalloregulator ArsR/SmtB family transcription factor [unclassified Mesorhizobium]TGQ08586.1 metalloregulator ArsR/SmtB family transcription factor [Mesorhizobium sp. M2E.F.Ca.ET.219.01.1.1]TGS14996.1 metalloregulator ArsR/SmtB family transcription factor [Mesorhizobium sp. M2E.F.Ca.ET.209.01.1.1]TGT69122.1 metalloregulator ArsR/SmtB family transcription factor [Mesorhizobium sp. M2E.F.Ca.ET.166.01.1.1]TGW01456.1 metalloregulator ArsR/SmtB family transcription factor [Mesorhiz
MSIRNPKQALYEQFAIVAKALGHPLRLEMIEHLAQGARSVDALAAKLGQPVANISQHLQSLRRAGIVLAERDGKFVHYSLADDSVLSAFASVRGVAERRLAEVDRIVRGYFDARDDMRPVTRDELQALMRDGLVTLIDVRPADEFALGHVPGAINVPLGEIKAWSAGTDASREVIAYCRGPWCVMSFEAVAALRSLGHSARRLEDGMPEWKAAGLPVEVAA